MLGETNRVWLSDWVGKREGGMDHEKEKRGWEEHTMWGYSSIIFVALLLLLHLLGLVRGRRGKKYDASTSFHPSGPLVVVLRLS